MDIENKIYQWYVKKFGDKPERDDSPLRLKLGIQDKQVQDREIAKIYFAMHFRGGFYIRPSGVPRFTEEKLLKELVRMDLVKSMKEARDIFYDLLNFQWN